MSGGSFDYFYSRAPGELRAMASTLADMADRCEKGAGDAPPHWAADTDMATLLDVGAYLRLLSHRVGGMARMFEAWERVMQDVEWWQSGDSGAHHVIESFRKLVPRHVSPNREPSKEP